MGPWGRAAGVNGERTGYLRALMPRDRALSRRPEGAKAQIVWIGLVAGAAKHLHNENQVRRREKSQQIWLGSAISSASGSSASARNDAKYRIGGSFGSVRMIGSRPLRSPARNIARSRRSCRAGPWRGPKAHSFEAFAVATAIYLVISFAIMAVGRITDRKLKLKI